MVRYAFEKVGMTSIFNEEGRELAVTLLKMCPAKIARLEKAESGKQLIIVEYDTGKKKKISRGWATKDAAPSDLPSPDFKVGQKLKLTGKSKGRGFQDVITRFGFAGGPASHGSRFHRDPGSVGMRTEPGRVMKGKKMPGRDGNAQVTLKKVKVASWSQENSLMAVVGGVPGAVGTIVFI